MLFRSGTMGRNLVLNIADHGFAVCGYDRDEAQQQRLVSEARGPSLPSDAGTEATCSDAGDDAVGTEPLPDPALFSSTTLAGAGGGSLGLVLEGAGGVATTGGTGGAGGTASACRTGGAS